MWIAVEGHDYREPNLTTMYNHTQEDSGKTQDSVQMMPCVAMMNIVIFGQDYLLLFCIFQL